VVTLSIAAEKVFLAYAEHRPDAQRGWDLPGAVFIPLPLEDSAGTGSDARRAYMRTRTLLLELATPDFSMPYNVIFMTGTLISLAFRSVFNMVTRTLVVVPMDATPGESQDATACLGAAKVATVVGVDEATQADAFKRGVQG
jgi:phosphatidylinositol glycan class T